MMWPLLFLLLLQRNVHAAEWELPHTPATCDLQLNGSTLRRAGLRGHSCKAFAHRVAKDLHSGKIQHSDALFCLLLDPRCGIGWGKSMGIHVQGVTVGGTRMGTLTVGGGK